MVSGKKSEGNVLNEGAILAWAGEQVVVGVTKTGEITSECTCSEECDCEHAVALAIEGLWSCGMASYGKLGLEYEWRHAVKRTIVEGIPSLCDHPENYTCGEWKQLSSTKKIHQYLQRVVDTLRKDDILNGGSATGCSTRRTKKTDGERG